jgi:hypothetical protein
MKSHITIVLLTTALSASADLREARQLLPRDAGAAAEHLRGLLATKPDDLWLIYNAAVAAYAARDYTRADEEWQRLAALPLPDDLREQVWLQIGNVSYRLVQPQIESEPVVVVPRLEQSREALRVALSANKKNKIAAQNLVFIEKELERVYARLAQRLAQEARKEPSIPKAIEKLEAALTYAQQAQALNPKDAQRETERKEIGKALAEKHDQLAAQHEQTADQRNLTNQWERQNAEQELQKALENFQQAQSVVPEDQVAQTGEKRIEQKLADLLAKAGRIEQRAGEAATKNNPEEAVEKFQQALDDFQQALAHVPEHRDAQAGEQEVRRQLEQLHLDQGDRQAERGEQQAERNPESAAQNLLGALSHFEQARGLNPENPEIPPRIERVASQLPPLLDRLGQEEQQRAEVAEQGKAIERAVGHLEKAETSFNKAQQIAPNDEPARRGQREVQAALARLRQQLAQRNQPQRGRQAEQPRESFESMLAKLKEEQKTEETRARHHTGQKYEEERNRTLRNW